MKKKIIISAALLCVAMVAIFAFSTQHITHAASYKAQFANSPHDGGQVVDCSQAHSVELWNTSLGLEGCFLLTPGTHYNFGLADSNGNLVSVDKIVNTDSTHALAIDTSNGANLPTIDPGGGTWDGIATVIGGELLA